MNHDLKGDAPDRLQTLLRGRIPALDGVRGVAILLVLLHQFNILSPDGSLAARLLTAAFEPGWIGVQLFFVLSGFLITGVLVEAKGAPHFFGRFYRRRVQRIFPLYYLVLTATLVVLPRVLAGTATAPALPGAGGHHVWYWLYLQNWPALGVGEVETLGHTWSLAVEEQYYLLWPLAVFCLSPRGLVRLCLGVVVGAFLLRVGFRAAGVPAEEIYTSTLGRTDALVLGGLVALAVRRADWLALVRRHLPRATVVVAVALAVVGVASHDFARKQLYTQTAGYSVLALAGALLIAWTVTLSAAPANGGGALVAALSFRPLRAIGRVSYGMYLFHLPLHLVATRLLLAKRLGPDGTTDSLPLALGYLLLATVVLYGVAQLSWTLFERRFLTPSTRENGKQ